MASLPRNSENITIERIILYERINRPHHEISSVKHMLIHAYKWSITLKSVNRFNFHGDFPAEAQLFWLHDLESFEFKARELIHLLVIWMISFFDRIPSRNKINDGSCLVFLLFGDNFISIHWDLYIYLPWITVTCLR